MIKNHMPTLKTGVTSLELVPAPLLLSSGRPLIFRVSHFQSDMEHILLHSTEASLDR